MCTLLAYSDHPQLSCLFVSKCVCSTVFTAHWFVTFKSISGKLSVHGLSIIVCIDSRYAFNFHSLVLPTSALVRPVWHPLGPSQRNQRSGAHARLLLILVKFACSALPTRTLDCPAWHLLGPSQRSQRSGAHARLPLIFVTKQPLDSCPAHLYLGMPCLAPPWSQPVQPVFGCARQALFHSSDGTVYCSLPCPLVPWSALLGTFVVPASAASVPVRTPAP